MSARDLYTTPVASTTWEVPASGAARFSWDYDDGRERLLSLYQKGKDKQWDSMKRIAWETEVDPYDALGVPDRSIAIFGTPHWERMNERERADVRRHVASWQFSQFLHGEQGAVICASRLVESVPDLDAKFYGATQVMDEARHVEIYSKFLREKLELIYPINDKLGRLLSDTLSDPQWDMPYLGMQVMIEGLALAAFGLIRDMTTKPLPKQILAYVMQDEARHVAFGRLALREHYRHISDAERREREDFVIEGCYLMQDRLRGTEVWENFGISEKESKALLDNSEAHKMFRGLLFSRLVPCVRDIGLWSERVQGVFADLGVLDLARQDLEVLMRQDEEVAEKLETEAARAEEQARKEEVDAVIAEAAAE
ncbi:ferritin-like domain-containing protein [Streptomyces sp. NRRL F-5123]|uniref:ferritin-like domain-containing protein n=1 Tax=Streptomyces sp. NRRL F-5123 TaxID=1463856 RepID=UPI0004E14282|nr:ferritin-like domain-containing protein [Streptomyces sp. NRRL F-5123]